MIEITIWVYNNIVSKFLIYIGVVAAIFTFAGHIADIGGVAKWLIGFHVVTWLDG